MGGSGMTHRFFLVTLTILLGYITAIKVAEYLQPQFITINNTDCFDHTRGKWKPDSTGTWVKIETGKKVEK
jgi:hypothetical protein